MLRFCNPDNTSSNIYYSFFQDQIMNSQLAQKVLIYVVFKFRLCVRSLWNKNRHKSENQNRQMRCTFNVDTEVQIIKTVNLSELWKNYFWAIQCSSGMTTQWKYIYYYWWCDMVNRFERSIVSIFFLPPYKTLLMSSCPSIHLNSRHARVFFYPF